MADVNLHPTVKEFKEFINRHPKLIEEIRKSGRSWQEYYEKWVLLGEDDPMWEQYKNPEASDEKSDKSTNSAGWLNQIMRLTENLDFNKVQEQVNQLSGTISTLQGLIEQFKQQEDDDINPHSVSRREPFNWFKD